MFFRLQCINKGPITLLALAHKSWQSVLETPYTNLPKSFIYLWPKAETCLGYTDDIPSKVLNPNSGRCTYTNYEAMLETKIKAFRKNVRRSNGSLALEALLIA